MESLLKLAKKLIEKNQKQYVYHLISPDFKGKTILPLSELKQKYPDIYKKEFKKYKDRENHPDIKIDVLNCSWKDCISLSTINPALIFNFLSSIDAKGSEHSKDFKIYRFDINKIENEKCYYDDNVSPKNQKSYSKIKSYSETDSIPLEAAKYFIKSVDNKEYPLIFGYVKHVLVKGNLDLSLGEEIDY